MMTATMTHALDMMQWATRELKVIHELMCEEGIPKTLADGSQLTVAQRVEMYVTGHRAARLDAYRLQKEKIKQ